MVARRVPRNYWYIHTNDTGQGFTAELVRVQWDQIDWAVPYLYRDNADSRAKKRVGKPVTISSERVLHAKVILYMLPNLRDHDLFYIPESRRFRRVGELMAERERRAEKRDARKSRRSRKSRAAERGNAA